MTDKKAPPDDTLRARDRNQGRLFSAIKNRHMRITRERFDIVSAVKERFWLSRPAFTLAAVFVIGLVLGFAHKIGASQPQLAPYEMTVFLEVQGLELRESGSNE